jgi:hypothetical protein
MFRFWLKPSQKTLALIYFGIPHGFARRTRECDFGPRRKPLGLLARLDRVPDRFIRSCCQTRGRNCEDRSHCYPYFPM